jgi:hypothetical protein
MAWGHGVGTGWELFRCVACLPVQEIGKANSDGKILDVPKKKITVSWVGTQYGNLGWS